MNWAKLALHAILLTGLYTLVLTSEPVRAAELPLKDVAPGNVEPAETRVSIDGDVARFEVSTKTGKVRYDWRSPSAGAGASNWLGQLTATVGDRAVLDWETQAAPQWVGGTTKPLTGAVWSKEPGGAKLTLSFGTANGAAKLELSVSLQGRSLVVNLACDKPTLTALDLGGWRQAESAQALEIPYNPFKTLYFRNYDLFTSAFFDWTDSNATKQNDSRLIYAGKTNAAHNILHDRFIIVVGNKLEDVLANSPAGRSKYFSKIAGKTIIDIVTTEKFDAIDTGFSKLIRSGLHNCILIVHNWQRDGYDNGFPSHYPANAGLGGDAPLLKLIASAKSVGCDTYLHENFIDYYPDYEKYDEGDISRETNNDLQKAWLNKKTGMQSFNIKPSKVISIAIPVATGIKNIYQTGGIFLDVNSSFHPWDRVDMDASVENAGMLRGFFTSSKNLFSTLQDISQGPVVGEGHNHFFWTGLLDGVEAQVTVGYKGPGINIPIIPDFDLRKIHEYQNNFGMGFFFRWSNEREEFGTDWKDFQIEHDRQVQRIYRAQEIVFGHGAFRTGVYWSDIERFWQEDASVGALSKIYAGDRVRSISYLDQGQWAGIESVLKAGHQPSIVRIAYSSGLEVTANFSEVPQQIYGHLLPKGGWIAKGSDAIAYEASEDGEPVSFSRYKDLLFADGRRGSQTDSAVSPEKSFEDGLVHTNGIIFGYKDDSWHLHGWLPEQGGHVSVELKVFGAVKNVVCNAFDGGNAVGAMDDRTVSVSGTGYFQCDLSLH